MRKRDRELSRIAKRFNRALEYTRNGHLRLVDKAGRLPPVVASASPSCHRALLNLVSDLRRAQA